jgi:mono/diheme cytochrome c family protein
MRVLLVWVGILLLPLLFLTLHGCAEPGKAQMQVVSGVVRADNGAPVSGATVRVQTTPFNTTSELDGHFSLSIPQPGEQFALTAWAPGYFIGGPVLVKPGDTEIEFKLHAHATTDNPDYQWLTSRYHSNHGEDQGCAVCHSAKGTGLTYSLPVDEWQLDAHANSARNPRFLTMYLGTDTLGNQSPPTQYVSKKDYGTEPIKPDPTLPYYGPGYKLDFPDTAGNCGACHTPAAAITEPYDTDPTDLEGVVAEGIPCDFCHKIWDVILDSDSGLPNQNMPGVLSYNFRRPPDGHQFFAGPFDDVAPGEDTYSALQIQSQFCAPCHYGVFWDVVIYDSFGEWLRSPYSDSDNGQTCQDCHMPRLGVNHFALPEQGGLARDSAAIFSHRMPGASDEILLQNAVSMTVTAAMEGSVLQVQVTLTNDQTGHHVPTDSPLRHLILLVSAEDERGQLLVQQDGPRLPDWCGVGYPHEGYYAGQPGMAYAKVLAEQWTNNSPTGAYWNPTYLISDNRLAPFSSDDTNYSFAALNQGPVRIQVRLLYRRAFIELAEQKGWGTPDILMEETILEIVP